MDAVNVHVMDALSTSQQRLWLAHERDPRSSEYTVCAATELLGPLDESGLSDAWLRVVARHAELRLRISTAARGPRRGAWKHRDLELVYVDSTGQDPRTLARAAAREQVPLVDTVLAAIRLHKIGPEHHLLIVVGHHAVLDGRAMAIVHKDLWAAYDGRPLAAPPPSYATFIATELQAQPNEDFDGWIAEVNVPRRPEPLGLPIGVGGIGKPAETCRLELGPRLWSQMLDVCARERSAPQVLGLAATALTVSRYLASSYVVLGGTMDVRDARFADTVGMFVNPTLVGVQVDDDFTVPEYLHRVQRSLLRSHQHRKQPFQEVMRRLEPAPRAHSAGFDVLFNYEVGPSENVIRQLRCRPLHIDDSTAKYPLTIVLENSGSGSGTLTATFRPDLHQRSQVVSFLGHVQRALEVLVTRSSMRLGDVEVLDPAEHQHLNNLGRGPDPVEPVIHVWERLRECALRRPEGTAVVADDATLTYSRLVASARSTGAMLVDVGVRPGDRVGIAVEPSARMVVAVLAVMVSGATYVPLNTSAPAIHLKALLDDAAIEVVIADESFQAPAGVHVVAVQAAVAPQRSRPETPAPEETDLDAAAYVIYTSGTTGLPKGVEVGHRELAASTAARIDVYGAEGTFLLVSPLGFDSSVAGLWGTLATGGTLVVARSEDVRDPSALVELIKRCGVTSTLCVPSLWRRVLDRARRSGDTSALRSLSRVITAGEALAEQTMILHQQLLPETELVNEYGPTETTVWVTYRRFINQVGIDVGRPIPGVSVELVDAAGRLVPLGAAGEVRIGGRCVARGYVNRPEETTRVFAGASSPSTQGRTYRSGDWGRWNDGGGLTLLGRRDRMVKVRGQRIELEAVEAALTALPSVAEAAATVADGGTALVAYIVGSYSDGALKGLVPRSVIPDRVYEVAAIPRTGHGKVDLTRLEDLLVEEARKGTSSPSADTLLSRVTEAWCSVLKINDVSPDANFFDVGGHSLLVVDLQSALEDRTGKKLRIVDLFAAATVRAQSDLLRGTLLQAFVEPGAPGQDAQQRRRRLADNLARRRGATS